MRVATASIDSTMNNKRTKTVEASCITATMRHVSSKEIQLPTLLSSRIHERCCHSPGPNGSVPWRKLQPARYPRTTRMIYVPDRMKALFSRPRRDQPPRLLNTTCLVSILPMVFRPRSKSFGIASHHRRIGGCRPTRFVKDIKLGKAAQCEIKQANLQPLSFFL